MQIQLKSDVLLEPPQKPREKDALYWKSLLGACCLLCWTGLNWFAGLLGRARCIVNSIADQSSQEGIECNKALCVSRVLKYPKKCLEDLAMFFIEFSRWLFWVTCKIEQPIQPIWQQIFALPWSALKKPPWGFNFFHIFGIPWSSRHEKCCQILQTLFWVFLYSRNSQCISTEN